MIKNYEQYHGVVLIRLLSQYLNMRIKKHADNSAYIINDSCGIYIKFSKKRLTPWNFTFQKIHYDVIRELSKQTTSTYVVLVCGEDGLCCVRWEEFQQLIYTIEDEETKAVSVARFKGYQYSVSGTDGTINHKFVDSEILL